MKGLSPMPATVGCAGQRGVWAGGSRASSGGSHGSGTSGSCPPGLARAPNGVSGRRNEGARERTADGGGWNLPRNNSARTLECVTAGFTIPVGWPPCMTWSQPPNRFAMPAAIGNSCELPFQALLLTPFGAFACQSDRQWHATRQCRVELVPAALSERRRAASDFRGGAASWSVPTVDCIRPDSYTENPWHDGF